MRAPWHPSCLCLNVTSSTAFQAPSRHASDFYKRVIHVFQEKGIDFLVGGAFAFVRYTGTSAATRKTSTSLSGVLIGMP